jgi:hypothetical protein
MKKLGTSPAAIINVETEAIIATGCVISGIPLLDKLNVDPIKSIDTGRRLKIDANNGFIEMV